MIKVKIDSRKVTAGDTFVAINGATVDGHNYIQDAIDNGATKIVVEKNVNFDIPTVKVKSTVDWLNNYVVENYKDSVNEMNLIGITGTNGKTTTAYLTYQMLNALNSKTAYIGTIGFYIPNEEVIELPNTTPNILDLYDLLLTAKNKGCRNVIMEVSSHALAFKRVEGLDYKVAAFTNLTQDHLDYHKTMDNYLEAKKLILKQLSGPIIINADDNYADNWFSSYDNTISLGKTGKDYIINSYKDTLSGTKIDARINDTSYQINTNLKSEFNVYNYMTALAIAVSLGYNINDVLFISNMIYPPKGRCEQIPVNGGIAVIDYAHTPDAMEKIIQNFKKDKKGKIITLIGCGGDRDPKKRPIMGNIATSLSDFAIFTSDNPRTENPNLIIKDIISGVKSDNYLIESDRIKAIHKGLDMLKENDILLLLGKGHEDYQIIGHEKFHLDDREEVEKYISNKKSS